MAQFTVRNLEDAVKNRLKRRAARRGSSLEEEVRQILRNAVKDEEPVVVRLGSRIAARYAESGWGETIAELRGQAARPLDFGR